MSRCRSLLLSLALVLTSALPALAQRNAYEQITIGATAMSISSTTYAGMTSCVVVNSGATIRMRYDGTDPTSSTGTPISDAGAWQFLNIADARVARFIRVSSSSTISVSCTDGAPSAPIGAGGGGSGGSVTQGTDPWIVAGNGVAGTAATGVLTVQGIASMTPLLVSPQTGSFATDNTVDGNPIGTTGPLVLCNGNSAALTAVTAGRAQYFRCNLNGELIVAPAPGPLVSGAITSAMTSTTSTSLVSGTASNYLYITSCAVSNASTTVSTDILLQDGSGGTTLYVLPAPAATVATTGGGGATHTFGAGLKVPTSGNALYAANVTTGSSTKISCNGYRSTVSY